MVHEKVIERNVEEEEGIVINVYEENSGEDDSKSVRKK